jgi:hypothetical protein
MEETLISSKTAKLAKEIGFDEPCDYKYGNIENEDVLIYFAMHKEHAIETGHINSTCTGFSAPTQALLQKWLRDTKNHDVFVIRSVDRYYPIDNGSGIDLSLILSCMNTENWASFDSYEKALETALFTALNVLKSKNL